MTTNILKWRLFWWAYRWVSIKNRAGKQSAKQKVHTILIQRWQALVPQSEKETAEGIVHAVWLGALLSSGTFMRFPTVGKKKRRLARGIQLIVGQKAFRAFLTAGLAWRWLNRVARGYQEEHIEEWMTP